MTRSPKPGPIRRRHTNSKLGCSNCKRKKIRCDENLPQCNNCMKAKKEQCSYLSLARSEINKIKLTHSLRNSQNKLLDSDYRLPTSQGDASSSGSSRKPTPKDSQSKMELEFGHEFDGIEFKHELTKLPMRIPTYNYPPLQYKLSTMDDFSSEFKVIYDSPPQDRTETGSSNPSSRAGSPLPNARTTFTKLNKIKHESEMRQENPNVKRRFISPVNAAHMITLMSGANSSKGILFDLMICLGRCIFLRNIKKGSTINGNMAYSVNAFSRTCFEEHSRCLTSLKMKISDLKKRCEELTLESIDKNMVELEFMIASLYYSNNFLGYCVLLLDFSMENFSKISSDSQMILETYLNVTERLDKHNHPEIIESMLKQMQYRLLFVKIPTYDKSHVQEISSNLHSLAPIFTNLKIADPELMNLKFVYESLVQFVTEDYQPLLEANGSDEKDTLINYPVHEVYNLIKKWTFAISNGPFFDWALGTRSNTEATVIRDLISVLHSYLYAIGASIKTCFPSMVYLFGVSFAPIELYSNKNWFTIASNDKDIRNGLKNQDSLVGKSDDVSGWLQRHNYFNLRMYSFFCHRLKIYLENSQWGTERPQTPERFANRCFPDISEKPIKDFNSTLIRPEHYPTTSSHMADDSKGHKCVIQDESMMLKFYTRNIETLNFFSKDYVLQFDFESMCLLRDYRPSVFPCSAEWNCLSSEDIRYYLEDRKLLIKRFK